MDKDNHRVDPELSAKLKKCKVSIIRLSMLNTSKISIFLLNIKDQMLIFG